VSFDNVLKVEGIINQSSEAIKVVFDLHSFFCQASTHTSFEHSRHLSDFAMVGRLDGLRHPLVRYSQVDTCEGELPRRLRRYTDGCSVVYGLHGGKVENIATTEFHS
jgi:hypothetical protein